MAYLKGTYGLSKRRAARRAYQSAKKARLGEGSRFRAVKASILAGGVKPRRGQTREEAAAGIAAWIGRKKLGKKKFQMLAAKGRRK